MNVDITPEPSADERRAILAALEVNAIPVLYESLWRASALADLRDGALAQESGSDPGVVEA